MRVDECVIARRPLLCTNHFTETVVLKKTCAANQAHLCSHSVYASSLVLSGSPANLDFRVESHHVRTLDLKDMRLPLTWPTPSGSAGLIWIERIRGTIQERLSFQIDGFLTGPSQ